MAKVLIVANRTVAGRKLLEAVRDRAQSEDAQFHLVVPLSRPRHGNVIYDHAERDAAQLRIDLAQAYLRQEGIELTGEIGDEDPYTATMDALATFPADEVIVSTLPQTRSGWLRRDLVERISDDAGRPVRHIVTDPEQDGQATSVARQRLSSFLAALRENGVMASGMIGDPDPYDAIMNALDLFTVDHIVISTLPETRSGWLRANLIDRVRGATSARVDHVQVALEGAPA
jgi:hypothetical protein